MESGFVAARGSPGGIEGGDGFELVPEPGLLVVLPFCQRHRCERAHLDHLSP